MDIDYIIEHHKNDFSSLDLFTAYSAGFPVHRLSLTLLVQEATEIDPIDLFTLRAIARGLDTPGKLCDFFGLDELDVDVSLADMLHNEWISALSLGPGNVKLSVLPTGTKVIEERVAYSQQIREAEVWVDAATGDCELKPARGGLILPKIARERRLFLIRDAIGRPRVSGDIDFHALQASVARVGGDVWPGTKLNLLLDVLALTPRGLGYRSAEVLVFQSDDGADVEFEVFESGARNPEYERVLRRLEEQDVSVVPIEPMPTPEDMRAFEREVERVVAHAAEPVHEETMPAAPVVELPQEDTRSRLREALGAAHAELEVVRRREGQQRLVRNQENRAIWIDVLSRDAASYVVMEFPWIRRDALDYEMIDCMRSALKRGVALWISWGINPQAADADVLRELEALSRESASGTLTIRYRGDTHRKLLLWDGQRALITSFNFGSFRGDPQRPVRQEIGAIVTAPDPVRDLEDEFAAFFGVQLLV